MIQILDANLNVIRTSRNLRGIINHCSRVTVRRVTIEPRPDGSAILRVQWAGGDHVQTVFQSARVCTEWCARRRGWPAAIVT